MILPRRCGGHSLGALRHQSAIRPPSICRTTSMAHSLAAPHPVHLDPLELDILNRRDAFGLPGREICDALIEIFFSRVAPILPVVNRHDFMRRYHDPANRPSILLLQAIFTVASRFLTDNLSSGNSANTPRAFYKKAKALYDAGYEQDNIAVIQAVILLGLYWDGLDGK